MTSLQTSETTKPMKFRALQDLLKCLKSLGARSHPFSPQLHQGLHLPLNFEVFNLKKYYNMSVERIIYMQSRGDYHSDIEKVWIQRGIAMMRGGLRQWRQQWDLWLVCQKKSIPRSSPETTLTITSLPDWRVVDAWVLDVVGLERLSLNTDQTTLQAIWN